MQRKDTDEASASSVSRFLRQLLERTEPFPQCFGGRANDHEGFQVEYRVPNTFNWLTSARVMTQYSTGRGSPV